MVAPAADQINSEFNIGSSALQAMVTSIFVLGYGTEAILTHRTVVSLTFKDYSDWPAFLGSTERGLRTVFHSTSLECFLSTSVDYILFS